eukprot:1172811-Pleurochrysis_carterae.AAC.1
MGASAPRGSRVRPLCLGRDRGLPLAPPRLALRRGRARRCAEARTPSSIRRGVPTWSRACSRAASMQHRRALRPSRARPHGAARRQRS